MGGPERAISSVMARALKTFYELGLAIS
jgi:hypothetical protein